MPRILIADDNPLSLHFLSEALHALGHDCVCAEDGARAFALARDERFDVLLLDLDMPQLGGAQVHERLRADAAAHRARHVATSAELDAVRRSALLALGFDGVLAKPTTIDDLAALLRALAAPAPHVADTQGTYTAAHGDGLLDDDAALRACGDAGIVASLRQMFVDELQALPAELDDCVGRGDGTALLDRLHRLRASCGFCGAKRLDEASRSLRRVVGTSVQAAALLELRSVAAETLRALRV